MAASDEPVLPRGYLQEGATWAEDQHRALRWRARINGLLALVFLALSLSLVGALYLLLPLKTAYPVFVTLDPATGRPQVVDPASVEKLPETERAKVTLQYLATYLQNREGYDPKALVQMFDMAALLTQAASPAARDLNDLFAPTNPDNPQRLYGKDATVTVSIKNISFLNERTAQVRFFTEERRDKTVTQRHWVSIIRFAYSRSPIRNEWLHKNALGFQVVEYRRDQESIQPVISGAQGSG